MGDVIFAGLVIVGILEIDVFGGDDFVGRLAVLGQILQNGIDVPESNAGVIEDIGRMLRVIGVKAGWGEKLKEHVFVE